MSDLNPAAVGDVVNHYLSFMVCSHSIYSDNPVTILCSYLLDCWKFSIMLHEVHVLPLPRKLVLHDILFGCASQRQSV